MLEKLIAWLKENEMVFENKKGEIVIPVPCDLVPLVKYGTMTENEIVHDEDTAC